MPASPPPSPEALLDALPPERRAVMAAARDLVRSALPAGYEERVAGAMLTYVVPLARHPATYNGQPLMYAALAAQKRHTALYLTGPAMDPAQAEALAAGFARAGKRLDMGKSCLRFQAMDDLALDAVRAVIASTPPEGCVALYECATARAHGG